MTKTNYFALSLVAAVIFSLLAVSPAFAKDDGNRDSGTFNLRSELKARLFGDPAKHDSFDDNDDDRHSSSSTTTVNGSNETTGTVTAVSGSSITIAAKNGATYTVNAANATFRGHENVTLSLADIAVGDMIKVQGTVSGNTIVAIRVTEKDDNRDNDHRKDDKNKHDTASLNRVTAGIVTSVNGSSFVIDPFGKKATTSVATNASTTFSIGGNKATTSSATLASGSHVVIFGSYSTSTNTITASNVMILAKGWGWLKHFFLR